MRRETPTVRAARYAASKVLSDPWEALTKNVQRAWKDLVYPFVCRERTLRRELRAARVALKGGT